MYLQKRVWKPDFLWLLIVSQVKSFENFTGIPQVVPNIWRFSLSILAIFINFFDFFKFPCYKETNGATYNRWRQQFFTFNILQIDRLTTISYIDIRLVLLERWREVKLPSPQKNSRSKSPALLGLRRLHTLNIPKLLQSTSL